MNVEELSNLSVAELRARATTSLSEVESMSAMERQHHLVEAQFYIDEIERRAQADERDEHEKIAKRDYKLEIWVIFLIGVEILLSIAGIAIGYREGAKQTSVLDALKVSVDSLNQSTSRTADNVVKLTQAQSDALDTQKQSLAAMKNQLDILREDQRQRIAELTKQPVLQIRVGARQITATNAKYEIILENPSPVPAKDFLVYCRTDNNAVTLSIQNNQSESGQTSFYDPLLGAGKHVTLVLMMQYPSGIKSFHVRIWSSGENIPQKNLGDLLVQPPA